MGAKALTVVTRSPEETFALGRRLGVTLGPGDVVACYGELGSGKTCFIQGVAEGVGVEGPVTSPTFILIGEYQGRLLVYHVDLYRLDSLEEILALGVEECLYGRGVTLIEWAEKLEPLLPPHTIRVRLSGLGEEPREIRLEGVNPEVLAPA